MRVRAALWLFLLCAAWPAAAFDAVRLDDDLKVVHLAPYMQAAEEGRAVFALRNSTKETLTLELHDPAPSALAVALGLPPRRHGLTRLFSSADEEFPAASDRIAFTIPAGEVRSFVVFAEAGFADLPTAALWLWTPEARERFEQRRFTMQMLTLGLLAAALLAALLLVVSGWRATPVAGVLPMIVWGGAVAVLLAGVWLGYRREHILGALALVVAAGLWAHIKAPPDRAMRPYARWVVAVADIGLAAALACGVAGVFWPSFAGIVGADVVEMPVAAAGLCLLAGAALTLRRRYG